MAQTIIKFELSESSAVLTIPHGATFLCLQEQHQLASLWFKADLSLPTVRRRFIVGHTGDTVGDTLQYLGTFQLAHGTYVGHVFEGEI